MLTAAGILLAYLLVAPAALGGTATWVSTAGASMGPDIGNGDLIIARPAGKYHQGDVVAYRSKTLGGTVVLHRIVGGTSAGFITKGDNNSWSDPDQPSSEQVLGRMWVHIPGGGSMLSVFTSPLLVLIALLATLAIGGSAVAARRFRRRFPQPPIGARRRNGTSSDRAAAGRSNFLPTTQWAAVAALASAGVALFAFSEPLTTRGSADVKFDNSAEMGYSARVQTPGIYAANRVRTGDPIFLDLAPNIDTHLHYRLGATTSEVSGTIQAVARIAASNGWEHTTTLTRSTPFAGPEVDHEATVDFTALRQAAQVAEKAVGTAFGGYTVEITYRINLQGTIDGQPVQSRYDPKLSFSLDSVQAVPLSRSIRDADGDPTMQDTAPGNLTTPTLTPATIRFIGQDVPVRTVRLAATSFALLTGTFAAVATALNRRQRRARSEMFGARLITASNIDLGARPVIDIDDADSLARIAAHYETAIIHVPRPNGDLYHVIVDDTTYRYHRPGESAQATPSEAQRLDRQR